MQVDHDHLENSMPEDQLGRRLDGSLSEEEIQQMIVLAGRLREQSGGELDDDAIIAVSEATGAPVDYIRLAMRSVPERMQKRSFLEQVKNSFLAFEPDTRRLVAAGVLGLGAGFSQFWSAALLKGDGGFFTIFMLILLGAGIYNATVSRSLRTAIFAGGILSIGTNLTYGLFSLLDGLLTPVGADGPSTAGFIFSVVACSVLGGAGFALFQKYRKQLGFSDPAADRHALLSQLLEIQTKLRQDEKYVSFISVDLVGSTRIKTENDDLAVEFTLNEYHKFIESVVLKHGGKIHSTAGDGVTCVFDEAPAAVAAGKAMQAGLFEFNAFRNKLNDPVSMRAAVHTGNVLAPGREATAVNFAHVIDVAAHLQKLAEPGTLAVSASTAMHVGGLDSIGKERISAEEIEAAIWRPTMRLNVKDLSSLMPPGLPGGSVN